ncbi:SdrD B-like domain-containing protein, partial [Kiritimatiellaeota bacterium B1221]|nr:SdrD B-like domain-containing protein [Kiritimatiellaeota bacterium B1221]
GEPGLSGVTVYLDLNSNGILDGGEPIAGTVASGAYDLTGLAPGLYSVRVDESTVATGFVRTGGSLPQSVTLAAGEDFNDADFGYQQQDARIGDFVWNDLNGDGVQDAGEPGLSGVTVYLDLNSNGVLDGGEPNEVTNGSGAYDFTGLAAGTYSVQVDENTVTSG